ncbi:MAG: hypothetical protein EXR74_09995 [Bdellovibrionales bacterium]|nr:hypothetical protein [Bdellovibrionales bacterium]
MKPEETEVICLISYEITQILLGGGPEDRGSFWKQYREELKLNKKTDYLNYHTKLCRNHLVSPKLNLKEPVYYRNKTLTLEKDALLLLRKSTWI